MKYTLKHSRRAKHLRLRVHPGGAVVLTAPMGASHNIVETFLRSRARWIENAVARMLQFKVLPVSGRRDYVKHKEDARKLVEERVAYWNQFYNYQFKRIAIKNTRRTWGSCSRKGNLNFSYQLLFLPRELADYVVVHELCHLAEHNHGRGFWGLVSLTQPDYQARRRELKKYLPRN